MDERNRRELAERALAGYVNGPEAATAATELALSRTAGAGGVVLVEGISDQIALETLAVRRGRDLDAEGVVVVPVGGAQGMLRHLQDFGPRGRDLSVSGLCDEAEADGVLGALVAAGIAPGAGESRLEPFGFFICRADLEDELIRAVGEHSFEQVLEAQGDLGSFRSLQRQPAWRDAPVAAQMRRFLGAGARRKLRYARLLIEALDLDAAPRPLVGALDAHSPAR